MLNVVDGCIPSDLGAGTTAEIEEERRLLYVAMTRAKDSLHLAVPQRFFTLGQNSRGDRHVYASRTRFIPETLLPRFDCTSWPLIPTTEVQRHDTQQVCVDIGARMRVMCGSILGREKVSSTHEFPIFEELSQGRQSADGTRTGTERVGTTRDGAVSHPCPRRQKSPIYRQKSISRTMQDGVFRILSPLRLPFRHARPARTPRT